MSSCSINHPSVLLQFIDRYPPEIVNCYPVQNITLAESFPSQSLTTPAAYSLGQTIWMIPTVMSEARKYTIYSSGMVETGFLFSDVVASFAALFHISYDKAEEFVGKRTLLKSELSESEAALYKDKINKLGLVAELVDSQTEPGSTPPIELAPDNTNTLTGEAAAEIETTVVPQLICPKCSTMQPKNEVCAKCGLIIDKYKDPDYRADERSPAKPSRQTNRIDATAGLLSTFLSEISALHKNMLAFVIGALLIFFGFQLFDSDSGNSSWGSDRPYLQPDTAGENVKQLMNMAELNHFYDGVGAQIESLFANQLPTKVEEFGGSSTSSDYLLAMAPKTFNDEQSQIAIANWLYTTLDDNDIDTLVKLYESPIVSKAMEMSRNAKEGTNEHASFLTTYESSTMGSQRRLALEKLVDVMALDKIEMMILEQSSANLLNLAASTTGMSQSIEQQRRLHRIISETKEQLQPEKARIRKQQIKSLAWRFESMDTLQLQILASKFDTREHRRLYRQINNGFREYLYNAGTWLEMKMLNIYEFSDRQDSR